MSIPTTDRHTNMCSVFRSTAGLSAGMPYTRCASAGFDPTSLPRNVVQQSHAHQSYKQKVDTVASDACMLVA